MKHLATLLILALLAWTGNEFANHYEGFTTLEEKSIDIENERYIEELEAATFDEAEATFLPMEVTLDEVDLNLINYEYKEELENTLHPALDRPVLEEIELNLENHRYEEELENA